MNFNSGVPLLQEIRNTLQRLEDTIIYALIERAQFAHNECVYDDDSTTSGIKVEGWDRSFLAYMMFQTECVHAKARRYTSPDEYPFTPMELLPKPILEPLHYPKDLLHPAAKAIRINDLLWTEYIRRIVPSIAESKSKLGILDDGNYGSTAVCDVHLLQAISRRIHLGLFVAESKFLSPEKHNEYLRLIEAQDEDGILKTLTDDKIEKELLERVVIKTRVYASGLSQWSCNAQSESVVILESKTSLGQSCIDPKRQGGQLSPVHVAEIYKNVIIPLTKKVEVDYLLKRA